MHEVNPAVVQAHVAKVTTLAQQHPFLATELEGICAALDEAVALGVPPVGQPVTHEHGRLEISRVTFQGMACIVVEWPDELRYSPDIEDLVTVVTIPSRSR